LAVNNPDDYTKGQLLSADDVNIIKNNGVVQANSLDDLDNAATSEYKVAYVNGAVYVANLGEWQPLVSTPELVEYEPMVGTVQMFYGDPDNDLDPGWVVCDGQNGTPDLRGRVPVGVNDDANEGAGAVALGDEIGNASHTLTAAQSGLPAHNVTVTGTPEGNVSDGTVSGTTTAKGTVGNGSVTVTGKTVGSNGGASATVYANYHNHYQWRTQKTAANGTGKSFYSFNGGASNSVQANNSIYRTDGANWAIGGSTSAPPFYGGTTTSTGSATGMTFTGQSSAVNGTVSGISFTGSSTESTGSVAAVSATEAFSLVQPAVGLHFVMYKGVTLP
jgi:hypothetical protein